jgi:hypothetical protein
MKDPFISLIMASGFGCSKKDIINPLQSFGILLELAVCGII